MPSRWPDDTDFALWELDVQDRSCPGCGRLMHVWDHRDHRIFTLDGPVQLCSQLVPCIAPGCPGHSRTYTAYCMSRRKLMALDELRCLIPHDSGSRRFRTYVA